TEAREYLTVRAESHGEAVVRLLNAGREYHLVHFPIAQHFDLAGLRVRLLSSSYVPEPGQPNYEAMLPALDRLFAAHAVGGRVTFEYDTEVYYGRLGEAES